MKPSSRGAGRSACAFLLACSVGLAADDLPVSLRADRAAVERVYYAHRLGDKPPFEQVLSSAAVKELIERDRRKEHLLQTVYGVEVTPAMVEAEVQRINTTTRDPAVLAELKTALDNDPNRFAGAIARPLVVERLLRKQFENDDALHAAQRGQAERARDGLLAARRNGASTTDLLISLRRDYTNQVSEATWSLSPQAGQTDAHPAGANSPHQSSSLKPQVPSTVQGQPAGQQFRFADLPAALQSVLRVQLRQPGDVSAVIETPAGFAVYLLEEKAVASFRVAVLSIPKRSYEQWLAEPSG